MNFKGWRVLLIVVIIILILIFMNIFTTVFNKEPVAVKNWHKEEHVNEGIPGCDSHFVQPSLARVKHLLNIKTTPETEKLLYRFGFPKRTNPSGDLYIPKFPDPQIKVPDIPVIVAAASSNHFQEMQAMMQNIDKVIRPAYPDIKVILYDIGFTEAERKQIMEYGKLELRRFRFDKYPKHTVKLKNYAWKPVLIAEVWKEFRSALFIDASIRFTTGNLSHIFKEGREKGHLLMVYRNNPYWIVNNTYAHTFDYFNVKPCQYHGIKEIGSGLLLINQNHLHSYALMRAWLTCTFQRHCIIPPGTEQIVGCRKKVYHQCHRYEQSALGVAATILYHRTVDTPSFPLPTFQVHRDHKVDYFKMVKPSTKG